MTRHINQMAIARKIKEELGVDVEPSHINLIDGDDKNFEVYAVQSSNYTIVARHYSTGGFEIKTIKWK